VKRSIFIGAIAVAIVSGFAYWKTINAPYADHLKIVKQNLIDPGSAEFRNSRLSRENKGVWCGEVNAKNRMGGMAGFTRYILMVPGYSPNILMGSLKFDGSPEFQESWNVWCAD